jgi:hypothetical protein
MNRRNFLKTSLAGAALADLARYLRQRVFMNRMVLVMAVLAIAVSPAFAAENLQRISGGRLAGAIAGLIQRQLLALNQGTVKSSP